jgi:hypothetical protein
MIHNEWIARDAVSAPGRFGHRIRIPPRAVARSLRLSTADTSSIVPSLDRQGLLDR